MIQVVLAPIWEFWNLSSSDYTLFGILLLLFGTYGLGFAQGRFPGGSITSAELPLWVRLAFAAAIVGFNVALIASSGDYIPEDRPGP